MSKITLLSRPTEMFKEHEQFIKRCESLIARVIASAQAGTIPDNLLKELHYFPEAYKALVLYPPVQDQLIEDLSSMPQVAYDIIVSDYESNAPYLETTLYNCPDLIFKLLVWSKDTKTELRYSQPFYDALLLEDLIWAIRWNQIVQNEQFPYILMDYVEENRFSDGGSACLFLQMNPKENALPYSSAIACHWRYALLSSVLFKSRGLNIKLAQSEAIQQPQWAYHFAKYVPETDIATCEATLSRHPLWLAQYIADLQPKRKEELGETALAKAKAEIAKAKSSENGGSDNESSVPMPLWEDFEKWLKKK